MSKATVRLWDKDFNHLSTHEAEVEALDFHFPDNPIWEAPSWTGRLSWESDGIQYTAESV